MNFQAGVVDFVSKTIYFTVMKKERFRTVNTQVLYSNNMNVTKTTQRSAKACMFEQRSLQYHFTQYDGLRK